MIASSFNISSPLSRESELISKHASKLHVVLAMILGGVDSTPGIRVRVYVH